MSTPCLDLIWEAVGWVTDDGTLQPRNRAMRQLCADLGVGTDGVSLSGMPWVGEDRARIEEFLVASDPQQLDLEVGLPVGAGERSLRLRLQRQVGGCWLVVDDRTELSRWRVQALRLERVRLAGAMGQGLVHDLNNVMSTLMGLADHMAELQIDPETREFLLSVVDGTRDRGALLKGLYRVLSGSSISPETIPLQSLFGDICGMFQKTAMHAEVEFTASTSGELPEVRVIAEDVLHALLVVLMHGIESAAGPIHLEAAAVDRPAVRPGLPARRFGCLRIVDGGDPELLSRLEAGLGTSGGGFRVAQHALGLFQVVMSLRRRGALLEIGVRPADGRRQIDLLLPVARPRAGSS